MWEASRRTQWERLAWESGEIQNSPYQHFSRTFKSSNVGRWNSQHPGLRQRLVFNPQCPCSFMAPTGGPQTWPQHTGLAPLGGVSTIPEDQLCRRQTRNKGKFLLLPPWGHLKTLSQPTLPRPRGDSWWPALKMGVLGEERENGLFNEKKGKSVIQGAECGYSATIGIDLT